MDYNAVEKVESSLKPYRQVINEIHARLGHGNFYIVGGFLRDVLLDREAPADLDVVVLDNKPLAPLFVGFADETINNFSGLRFTKEGLSIDIWNNADSWSYSENQEKSVFSVLSSFDFTINCIAYSPIKKQFMEAGFFDALEKKKLILANPDNVYKNYKLIARIIGYAKKLEFGFDKSVKDWFDTNDFSEEEYESAAYYMDYKYKKKYTANQIKQEIEEIKQLISS